MIRITAVLLLLLAMAGCETKKSTFPGHPRLSLVGEGLAIERAPLPVSFTEPDVRSTNSLWSQKNLGLFHDRRARKVGDIVTVTIDIDDKAEFENASGRSKQGKAKGSFAASLGWSGFGLEEDKFGEAAGDVDVGAEASSKGEGSIDRSEKLSLSIAAVVTEVLPDGNLLITGTQEVRVNHEVRVLNIAGIVRPLDIAKTNVISYEKIAEARISYGGRGKISAVQ
jgi:flagellar L-ring protein precursor FlgH